jgi:UDP-glucose 4-epimerase
MKEASVYAGRRVLVTGGTGFLGSNLVAALRAAGADVGTLSRGPSNSPSPSGGGQAGGGHFQGDLRDRDLIEAAVAGTSVIFNLAGHSGSTSSNLEPFEDLDVNLRGHLTLLEACRQLPEPPTVVFPSSRLVYRPTTQIPVPETWLTGPLSLYGVHKLAAEHYHLLYAHLYGLKVAILRITNPYGFSRHSSDNRYSIINWFIHLAITDQVLPVYGEGRQLRDYVHVDDVVRAFLLAGADARAAGQIFNVGSGTGVSFGTMAETVIREAGAGRIEPRPWPDDAARVAALDTGLREVIRQYRQMENVR